MAENPDDRFLVAAPTNLLKNELYHKAIQMDIEVCKTPSLEEIKNEIPEKIRGRIERFHQSGQHQLVHPYIEKILNAKDISCLRKYMKEREALRASFQTKEKSQLLSWRSCWRRLTTAACPKR